MPFYSNLLGSAGVNQPVTTYEISRSVRFNSADSAYLSRTPASAGNRKTWTWAGWVKRSQLGIDYIFTTTDVGASGAGYIRFANDVLAYWDATNASAGNILLTNAVFRDLSAWYHIVLAVNYSAAVAADRAKFYVNGIEQSYSSTNYPLTTEDSYFNDTTAHYIAGGPERINGYLADIHFIDGQALDPTSFGKFDANNVWQPKAYTGTYPGNSFHLDFSDNSSAAALGTDTSGNGNDWTVNNFSIESVLYSGYFDVLPVNSTYPFTSSYFSAYVNTSTGVITDLAWVGAYRSSGTVTWTPPAPIPVTSSIDVYGGSYNNSGTAYTITVTYTDLSTSTFSSSSGSNNWVDRLSASVSGKSIQSISVDATSWAQLCAVRIDGTFLVDALPSDNDSLVDSPTNGDQTDTGAGAGGEVRGNYATWNPLYQPTHTYSNGNLDVTTNSAGYVPVFGSMFTPAGFGKWYWEITINTSASYHMIGALSSDDATLQGTNGIPGYQYRGWNNYIGYDGSVVITSGLGAAGNATSTANIGDVVGVAFDADNGTVRIYINGVAQGAGNQFTSVSSSVGWTPAVSAYDFTANSYTINTGQRPFAYTAPSGYKALCTTNLEPPTIADGSQYFQVIKYTGNGTTQTLPNINSEPSSGLNFSPDLVWVKARSNVISHFLYDTVRGFSNGNALELRSNQTNAEGVPGAASTGLTAFNSDGFSLGSDGGANTSSATYVGWTWDAGSSTVSNTDGSITSQVRANPTAGFSIVTYTGDGAASGTIGHGLNVAPQMIMVKNRDVTDEGAVYHVGVDATNPQNYFLTLFSTSNGANARSDTGAMWNDTAPTSSVFSVGTEDNVNASTEDYIAYCFTGVDGYSSFGSYTGNGSADGPFVYTGFRPRWLLIKNIDGAASWTLLDSRRLGYNGANSLLFPDIAGPEAPGEYVDLLANGFKSRGANVEFNNNTQTYVYAAFAEHPFQYARAR